MEKHSMDSIGEGFFFGFIRVKIAHKPRLSEEEIHMLNPVKQIP
jgi:hypothetical protein